MKDGESVWETPNLGTLPGIRSGHPPQPMGTTLASMVDGAGYIHMSGNYHRVPLSYIRSAAPNEVTGGWETPGMVGSDQTEVTYPAFVKVGNGDLLFFYKSGTSSGRDLVLKSYSATTKRWARVGMVLEGHDWDGPGTEDLSAYPSLAALPEPVPVASEYKQLAGACPRRSCAAEQGKPEVGNLLLHQDVAQWALARGGPISMHPPNMGSMLTP